MRALISFVTVGCMGCSHGSDATKPKDGGAGDAAEVVRFHLHGQVLEPVSSGQPARVVVGILKSNELGTVVNCQKFVTHVDLGTVTLPVSYDLTIEATGQYDLVGLLPVTPTARTGIYPMSVDSDGIHYKSPNTTSMIDITLQGAMSDDCP